MLATLSKLREDLYALEIEIAKTKAELEEKELCNSQSRAKAYKSFIAKGVRFKNTVELELAVESSIVEHLPNLEKDIINLREDLGGLKAKHAIRRREYREAEAEHNISGSDAFNVYDFIIQD